MQTAFTKLGIALEAASGTPESAPEIVLNVDGKIKPEAPVAVAKRKLGVLAETTQSKTPKQWSAVTAGGSLDVNTMIYLGNLIMAPLASGVQVDTSTAYAWTFDRVMSGKTLKSATGWWGDPGVQMFQSGYILGKELSVSADGSGNDEVQFSFSGVGQFPEKVTNPTWPAAVDGGMIVPMDFEVWLDADGGTFGTTQLTGRVMKVDISIPSGQQELFVPSGPSGSKTFSQHGVGAATPEMTVTMLVPDMVQWDQFVAESMHLLRVRFSGDVIETTHRDYVQFDIRGKLQEPDWDEAEGVEQTVVFKVRGHYDSTIATDLTMEVQAALDAL